jgi:hypothetical protein
LDGDEVVDLTTVTDRAAPDCFSKVNTARLRVKLPVIGSSTLIMVKK